MPTQMKTISKLNPGLGAEIIMRDIPAIGDDEILIKNLAVSICGTDVHIYEYNDWAKSRIATPQILGHELAGQVVKIGKFVTSVEVGDIVSAETHIVCGECEFCRKGQGHICLNTSIIGVDRDGAFAEYIAIPARNAWINDPAVDPAYLCLQEPLGNAIHTVLAGETAGKTLAVVGCGPIGIMAVDVAKAVGAAHVFAIDLNDYRLDLAKKLGADVTLNPKSVNVIEEVMRQTHGLGVDVVCEMSGSATAFNQALKYLKKGGRMSILGLPDHPFEIDVANDIVFKGITINGITGRRIMETWQQGKELIDSGKLHLQDIVTHILPFEDYAYGFRLMHEGNCGKVVLRIGEKENL
jgi:threonine 3-dehydrogenase